MDCRVVLLLAKNIGTGAMTEKSRKLFFNLMIDLNVGRFDFSVFGF